MRVFLIAVLLLVATVVQAADKEPEKVLKVYEVNRFGQTQYHKTHVRVKGDKAVSVNKYGQTQHDKTLKVRK